MEDPNNTYPDPAQQSDPLLQPGAFIDPNPNPTPTSNGKGNGNGKSRPEPVQPPQQQPETQQIVEQKTGSTGPIDVTDIANRPDWLPSHWLFKETLRTSGASAGSKDKYFIDPATNQRFRSKKEVFHYLETGTTPKQLKRKNAKADAENTPKSNSEKPKRKKVEAKAKVSMKNFNFDEVPEKVKWELIDVFEGIWRPLINNVDRVPESSKQEWTAAFTYLTLQNSSRD